MDKQTLSNYGWVVIVTLILAVMLALATPFGNYTGDAVVNIANGFVGTSTEATGKDNISQKEVEWAVKADHGIDYNTYKYYNDLEKAVDNVTENNGASKLKNNDVMIATSEDGMPIVRLVRNITVTEPIQLDKSFILDTNGHTLTIECENGFILSDNVSIKIRNTGKIIHNTIDVEQSYTFDASSANNYNITFDGGEYVLNFNNGVRAHFFNGYNSDKTIPNTIQAEDCTFIFNSNRIDEAENKSCTLFYTNTTDTASFKNCTFNANVSNIPTLLLLYARGNNYLNKCTFNVNALNSRVYPFYNTGLVSELNDCAFNINQEGLSTNTYNIYNYKGTMTLNNCNVKVNLPDSSTGWTTCVSNSGGILNVNSGRYNIYADHNADIAVGISTINGGTSYIKNTTVIAENVNTSISSGEEESKNAVNEHYSYAVHMQDSSTVSVSNSNILAKGTDVQVTPFRLQSASTANISNTNIEAILTRVAPPNGDMGIDRYMREYVIFANHKPVNTVNIDNSHIKGHYAFYNGGGNNLFNIGENMTYDITSMYE